MPSFYASATAGVKRRLTADEIQTTRFALAERFLALLEMTRRGDSFPSYLTLLPVISNEVRDPSKSNSKTATSITSIFPLAFGKLYSRESQPMLQKHGIKTVIVCGTSSNQAVTHILGAAPRKI